MKNIGRELWNARPAKPGVTHRPLTSVTDVVFHYADAHSVSEDTEPSMVRSIQDFHMDTRGWLDIGYHACVGMTGNVYAGRPLDVVGAHCQGFNTPSIGICFLTAGGISPAAGDAAIKWLQLVEWVAFHKRLTVWAHREKVATGCPGDTLFSWVTNVRSGVLFR